MGISSMCVFPHAQRSIVFIMNHDLSYFFFLYSSVKWSTRHIYIIGFIWDETIMSDSIFVVSIIETIWLLFFPCQQNVFFLMLNAFDPKE